MNNIISTLLRSSSVHKYFKHTHTHTHALQFFSVTLVHFSHHYLHLHNS